MRRTGGLIVSRLPLESVTLRYPDGLEIEVTLGRINPTKTGVDLFIERRWQGSTGLVSRMSVPCDHQVVLPGYGDEDETIVVPSKIDNGKVMIRILADQSILVLRTELLQPELKKKRRTNAS